jgi:hypothetical protein
MTQAKKTPKRNILAEEAAAAHMTQVRLREDFYKRNPNLAAKSPAIDRKDPDALSKR